MLEAVPVHRGRWGRMHGPRGISRRHALVARVGAGFPVSFAQLRQPLTLSASDSFGVSFIWSLSLVRVTLRLFAYCSLGRASDSSPVLFCPHPPTA